MQAIEVTARFSSDGKVQPLKLRWQGREYQVEAAGRRWQAEDGLHILIIAVTGHAFELLFDPLQGQWYLVHTPSDHMFA